MSDISWRWLGRLDYGAGTAAQEAVRARVLAGDDAAMTVLLLEHEPVLTLGRNADERHILGSPEELARRGVAVCRASRGGDVTYHGPGQLMVYPVVRIAGSVVTFLEAVAGALASVAAVLGVPGAVWQRDPAGLWLGEAKLAACGLHLRRRVTCHGFAFNVATPPAVWQLLVPCGLPDRQVTSIADQRQRSGLAPPPAMEDVAALAGPALCAALPGVIDR